MLLAARRCSCDGGYRRSCTAASSLRRAISYQQLTIERVTGDNSKFVERPANEDLVFGTAFTDHMLQIEWDRNTLWGAPRIVPYQNLSLSPAASCLHYGLQCFEGMKAYKSLREGDDDDSVRLFRPDKNMERLSGSMDRLHMPGSDFDRAELTECIAELVRTDARWIPSGPGYSLYIRPAVIATHRFLGLSAPDSVLLYVICSPVGPYYRQSGFQPVRLTADSAPYVRAWPGGTGANKVGGNYAATMKAQHHATAGGYGQVLWLWGDNDEVTEVGAMNVFFVLKATASVQGGGATAPLELVTPPLDRGDILPGVTRDSILHLARTKMRGELVVSERSPTMAELQEAARNGRLVEAFGAGTAAVVAPIRSIRYRGTDIEIPNAPGPVTRRFWDEITGIQYGTIEGPPGWSVKI